MNFDHFDLWWRKRGDEEQLSQMRVHLQAALKPKTSRDIEYSIRWRLARWHHFVAMMGQENSIQDRTKNAREHFATGARIACYASALRQQVGRETETVESGFWWAVNAIEAARLQHKLATLLILPRTTQVLENIARYNEAFHHAGALRVLGRITHLKPRFLGGGAKKSLRWFQDALDIAPQNSTTRLYYAQALLDASRNDDAHRELETLLSQPRDEDWIWEQKRDREQARALLQKRKG